MKAFGRRLTNNWTHTPHPRAPRQDKCGREVASNPMGSREMTRVARALKPEAVVRRSDPLFRRSYEEAKHVEEFLAHQTTVSVSSNASPGQRHPICVSLPSQVWRHQGKLLVAVRPKTQQTCFVYQCRQPVLEGWQSHHGMNWQTCPHAEEKSEVQCGQLLKCGLLASIQLIALPTSKATRLDLQVFLSCFAGNSTCFFLCPCALVWFWRRRSSLLNDTACCLECVWTMTTVK